MTNRIKLFLAVFFIFFLLTSQSQDIRKNKDKKKPDIERKGEYTIEQSVSDNAQLKTIAFDGLAFLSGNLGSYTFFPPGKLADYFGFQYMRDIDAVGRP